jgi:hypothetical protein
MLQNEQGKNTHDESSDDEAKVIDNLMSELTADQSKSAEETKGEQLNSMLDDLLA